MKKAFVLLIGLLTFVMWIPSAFALDLGTNITIYDNQSGSTVSSATQMGYTGIGVGNEDQETEPGTLRDEAWDLEAFFLKGSVLSMVGQWDFVNGEGGASGSYDNDGDGRYTSGDIFIDLNNDDDYEYVFDVDWSNSSQSYVLYKINSASYINASYKSPDSDPWKIDIDKSSLTNVASGNFFVGIDESLGFYGSSDHNYVTGFDLSAIFADSDYSGTFLAHFTMECGNDELEGKAPVPEPATIMLFGMGLIGIASYSKLKLVKKT